MGEMANHSASQRRSPEAAVDDADEVEHALASLTREEADVLRAAPAEGLFDPEIAPALGVGAATARRRWLAALALARDALGLGNPSAVPNRNRRKPEP